MLTLLLLLAEAYYRKYIFIFTSYFMKERFDISPVSEKISPEQMKLIVQDVIDSKYELFDVKTMANYDADFSGDEPCFINIWNKQKGYGFGYIVFHDFLRRVGVGETFLSTDFTIDGSNLFQKAVNDGLIKKVSEPFGLQRLTRWEVVSDPVKNLEKIKDQKIFLQKIKE